MIEVPSRMAQLIGRLEAGEEISSDELRSLARLQALDVARLGEVYLSGRLAEEDKRTREFDEL